MSRKGARGDILVGGVLFTADRMTLGGKFGLPDTLGPATPVSSTTFKEDITSPSKMEETRMLTRETIFTGDNQKCLEVPF